MSTNPNVGLVTIHVLVNTEDMNETVKQLKERISSHETTIDCIAEFNTVHTAIIESVEKGTYKIGDLTFSRTAK